MGRRAAGMATAVVAVMAAVGPVAGQDWVERGTECRDDWGGRDAERACLAFEAEVAATGELSVDGGMNGSISVEGWNRDFVSVEAQVWARARSRARAADLASEIRLIAGDGSVRADGPRSGRESWGVNWTILVPADTDLDLESFNGGLTITDVDSQVRFEALNGGVTLDGLAGDVSGTTTNGGLRVLLDGDRWDGRSLDVETTNGGVTLVVPNGYSADLEARTTNGGISVDFPVTVRGRIGRTLSTTLGEGGPPVRVKTTNGGVKIVRSESAVRR